MTEEQVAVPAGWQLVPVELTSYMIENSGMRGRFAREIWSDMLAAAPKPEGFYPGQRVMKVTGDYKISGVVRSVFTKGDGAVRIVVEHTVRDEHGDGSFLHIYGPNNLEPLPEGGAS